MKRTVFYEVRHDEGTERRLTLRDARVAYVDAVAWHRNTVGDQAGPVTIVRVTIEDVPAVKPRAKKRLTLFEGAKLMPSSVLVSTSPLKPRAKRGGR